MWIVRLALRRPYTFVVAAMLVAILGVLCILSMPTDIFPVVDIPVISVAFNFTGMSPSDMEARIVTPYERLLGTTVNGIEHIESQSLYGVGVIKIYFQPNAKIENANAQVTAVSQTAIRQMPTGTQPPLIIEYNASNVPVIQLSVGSDTLPESAMFDQAWNFMRPQLIVVPGVQIPYPYGGRQRFVMVDLDTSKLYAYGISPLDVSNAINAQNLILPAGTTKIGKQEYPVTLNASPTLAAEMNDMPIKSVNGTTVFVRDVANVRDGYAVQTNTVHADGKPGVLISILKAGGASTLQVVNDIKSKLPHIKDILPPALKVTPLFDQSIFVRASVFGVVKEATIAAGLTGLMILLFLGSWRSTLIVMVSIPLSILVSIIVLDALGETLNVMTLGGMALAVGILVDDATVEIENIHRNLHQRKRLVQAILDGAAQIAVPAFVSTLCICIVFVPVVFISGAAKYLFTPLAMAVVFAMLTSYLLSRTLVPTMVHYLLAAEVEMYGGVIDQDDPHAMHAREVQEAHKRGGPIPPQDQTLLDKLRRPVVYWPIVAGMASVLLLIALLASPLGATVMPAAWHAQLSGFIVGNWDLILQALIVVCMLGLVIYATGRFNLIWRSHDAFNVQFEKLRRAYGGLLSLALDHQGVVVMLFTILVIISLLLAGPWGIGQDFFPSVDTGQMRLHVRCPPGTRLEQSTAYYGEVEDAIRTLIPKKDIAVILDNIGIPNSSINLSLSDGSVMSAADGEILISLSENHGPTDNYQRVLRRELARRFPDLVFWFAPADIVTQVLNFGLQAPIDVQVTGPLPNAQTNLKIATAIREELNRQPGIVDLRLQQVPRTPTLGVEVDRTLASQVGVKQADVASDLLVSLSSNNQTAPNYWLDTKNGVNYNIEVQTPQYKMNSVGDLDNTPIVPTAGTPSVQDTQVLGNIARLHRTYIPTNITHYNISPSYDVLMGVDGTDLGRAATTVNRIVDQFRPQLPRGSLITVRGQVKSMSDSFLGLGGGLIFAVVLVYLLMVVNFQSWIDPFIILMALPGAMAGILWMLWATGTTISVPALMGAIMSIGVATANSILMITFANDQRKHGLDSHDAALAAGLTRLRPVLMTALAMIIGMLPMSLGLGEGGEQNAPLGRAVIGGLSMATFATLFFVPVVYSRLRRQAPVSQVEPELM
jgi:multidrug efflux pump subunit AcrB